MASSVGATLVVQNLNVQSDSADLLGGFRPVQLRNLAHPLLVSVLDIFPKLFSRTANASFLKALKRSFDRQEWKPFAKGMNALANMALRKLKGCVSDDGAVPMVNTWLAADSRLCVLCSKNAHKFSAALGRQWQDLAVSTRRFARQVDQVHRTFAFSFVEGVLVRALKEGHWILLDEINLAGADILQRCVPSTCGTPIARLD